MPLVLPIHRTQYPRANPELMVDKHELIPKAPNQTSNVLGEMHDDMSFRCVDTLIQLLKIKCLEMSALGNRLGNAWGVGDVDVL